jgi:hypothetical protein
MNEHRDNLEAELLALRPQPISAELRRRIGNRLEAPMPTRSVRERTSVLVCCLTAACLMAVIVGLDQQNVFQPPRKLTASSSPTTDESSEPTLLTYQRALAQSADDLQALLNQRIVLTSTENPGVIRATSFARSETMLHSLLGEY